MLKYDFEESIGYWLLMASRAFERAINDELLPHGITFRQCQVLGWLALEGDLSQVELAERLRVEPPALVDLLDRMERCGWISRESCPGDRRKKLIRPRPEAKPVWDKVMTCARRVRARAVEGIEPDQVQVLMQLLRIVETNLGGGAAVRSQAEKKTA